MKKQISVTVMSYMSPRIENWLESRDIDYEVEVVRTKENVLRLKILSYFPSDDKGKHMAEVYKRFLERLRNKEDYHHA